MKCSMPEGRYIETVGKYSADGLGMGRLQDIRPELETMCDIAELCRSSGERMLLL
jgi:hypothetical protein